MRLGLFTICLACVLTAPTADTARAADDAKAEQEKDKEKKKAKAREKRKRKKKAQTPSDLDPEAAAWMKAGTPGKEHRVLNALIGNFDVAATFWPAPGAPAMESKATSRYRWALGKRFVRQDYRGEYAGMQFQGLGYIGYDNLKKVYTSLWMDSMSTSSMLSEGKANDAGNVITWHGTHIDPVTNQEKKSRYLIKIESKDRHVGEMYDIQKDGTEFKMMKLVYTRKADAAPRKKRKKAADAL